MIENDANLIKISQALLDEYACVCSVNVVNNEYQWYWIDPSLDAMQIEPAGTDFFKDVVGFVDRVVYEEDRQALLENFNDNSFLEKLRNNSALNNVFRLVIDGRPVYHSLRLIRDTGDDHCFIFGAVNIDKDYRCKLESDNAVSEQSLFDQIAESLVSHYDVIYYVDFKSNYYTKYVSKNIYGSFDINSAGDDFFEEARQNGAQLIHPKDRDRILNVLEKEYLIAVLEDRKRYITEYRLIVDGKTQHTRMTVMWSSDKIHIIIGVENINEQVRKEKEQFRAMSMANELARCDELTGVKNKKAYHELEESVNSNISNGLDYLPFAIVVCDVNDLKRVNDTQGSKSGDEYIRSACRFICNTFKHSQVFRIGGDEFVAFLGSGDFYTREDLVQKFKSIVFNNIKNGEGAVVAIGMSVFDPATDKNVIDVFERADSEMKLNKAKLKSYYNNSDDTPYLHRIDVTIPPERKKFLEGLFNAFSVITEGTYVYLCDMKYDYSIWSKAAVDTFGLPSEHMYRAGDIWEEHIHPDDRATYHRGINDIFTGNAAGHDMQYRARRLNGKYDVCTCRGIVLRDQNGDLDYFGGSIRNHGLQGQADALTGLRNLYGFFEDLQSYMNKNTSISVCLVGISKFSEINEIYGYHFGNRVLQGFGRFLFEHVGNLGSVYRLDGTKFAVLSNSQTVEDIKEKYEDLREYFREKFVVENKNIILDLNCGLLCVDNFDIDYQTVYACLNYSYSESKLRKHGEIVEFSNDINDENKHIIEKLHVIRDSIMRDYKGFFLLYQPVVDAQTEKLVGAEALLRWRNDEYGTVPPDSFIPVLERDPLFPELGEWIIRTAIKAAKRIMQYYPDFIINVNLSYSQLEKPEFVETVLNILRKENFPPNHLCLEITERCRLLNMDLLKNIVVNLRGRGVLMALDDFGTGFSSVGLVKNLEFDVIKIDRSFVLKIEEDEKERKLIEHFVGLGSIFGASICVEGIETSQMRDVLKKYGVSGFQGYYYSKPILIDDLLKWKDPDK